MKFLSNSLANLLSKSKFVSLFSNSHNNKKLKLLGGHVHDGIFYFSLLPTNKYFSSGDDDVIWFNFPTFGRLFYPFASCKSLLLSRVGLDQGAALWNPTTDEFKKLRDCPRGWEVFSYGFGKDPASQDYKVIRFVGLERGHRFDYPPFRVELYSLKTDSWKDITSRYPHLYIPMTQPSVHINGFYYWAVIRIDSIVSFDFFNEKFSHIPLCEAAVKRKGRFADASSRFLLVNFHGSLAALVYTYSDSLMKNEKPFEFEIWAWNGESWTRVPTNGIPSAVAVAVEASLGLFENDQLYLRDCDCKMLLFDCATGVLKDIGLNVEEVNGVHVFPYVESFVPLNGKKITRANWKIVKNNNSVIK